MSLPVILRPEADGDLQIIHDDFEQVRPGLGHHFISKVRQALIQIELMPELYGTVWRDIRAVRLRQFNYVVYYVIFVDRTEVLAIMHGSRHASAWRSRG